MDTDRPRWFSDVSPGHSGRYVRRMRDLAASGGDLTGEARLVDALVAPGSRILDAGCGTGRVGAALHERGHEVVGIDVDPVLIEAAREDHEGPAWIVADLARVSADTDAALGTPFDAVALAGNVLVYLAPGSEGRVLSNLAGLLRPDGVVVAGFATDRAYSVPDLDADAERSGLAVEHRFATWDLRPWRPDAEWAVSVLRRT